MNISDRKAISAPSSLATVVFYLIRVLMFPISLLGKETDGKRAWGGFAITAVK